MLSLLCSSKDYEQVLRGSSDVFANSRPICRQGDSFSEDKVMAQGSKTVFANGHGIGRVGDSVSCGFKVISGSSNVFSE
ncbi:PAAR domain-containing protein [Wolbachia endosymbiont (group A) of Longitarsus flavicornis]|uniref:PAAR domain-containing protein n=1 Tax=Wolbachia endosymbiont (group A) of Longitarsus flavicornis TaxID=3066134 RepID=UPI0030CA5B73